MLGLEVSVSGSLRAARGYLVDHPLNCLRLRPLRLLQDIC